MNTSVDIDEGVALPEPNRGRRNVRYPFAELQIGQSFFVPAEDNSDAAVVRVQGTLHSCARNVSRRTGARFTTRQWTQGEQRGIRVWRIEADVEGEA